MQALGKKQKISPFKFAFPFKSHEWAAETIHFLKYVNVNARRIEQRPFFTRRRMSRKRSLSPHGNF